MGSIHLPNIENLLEAEPTLLLSDPHSAQADAQRAQIAENLQQSAQRIQKFADAAALNAALASDVKALMAKYLQFRSE